MQLYPKVKSGSVISAVDLIRGIGRYAGLEVIIVPGATGLADTNYEGKTQAALEELKKKILYSFTWKPATKRDTMEIWN